MHIKHDVQPTIELNDIQGIIIRGYGYMPSAYYLMLTIENPALCKQWLGKISDDLTHGMVKPEDACKNIAFTKSGFETLGLSEAAMNTFTREFQEGMNKDYRQRMLGDIDDSAPINWDWGYSQTDFPAKDKAASSESIHICYMIFAKDDAALEDKFNATKQELISNGMAVVRKLDGRTLAGRKEHFGFRDGISQPTIAGIGKVTSEGNTCKTGEFILGYENEYDQYPDTPMLPKTADATNLLPESPLDVTQKDFGKNGTYMVFRMLEQDVKSFWTFVDKTGKEVFDEHPDPAVFLASKMIGRWPSGAPITKCPFHDDPSKQDDDNFYYAKSDPDGMKCPIGAHLRRANPRDAFIKGDPKESVRVTKRNRIIRRGRAYGNPLVEDMDPKKMIESSENSDVRGLNFIAFNSSIARQFELIQQSWINDPKFLGLYEDADPMLGHDPRGNKTTTFTIPAEPVRKRIQGIPQFIQTKGGAYFFMPGLKAVKYLSTI